MKRVSFSVADALKKAGYPCEVKAIEEAEKLGWQGKAFFTGMSTCALCPYVMDVWLWLWREKHIEIEVFIGLVSEKLWTAQTCGHDFDDTYSDPEEAIEKAIEYLVEHDLIK